MVMTIISIALVLGFAPGFFIHMDREIKYESLYDLRCVFEGRDASLRFSFVFVDSFLSITHYKLTQRKEGDRINFYVTFAGRNLSNPKDVPVNKNIRNKDGRIEVSILGTAFNPVKDELYYKAGTKVHRLQISSVK